MNKSERELLNEVNDQCEKMDKQVQQMNEEIQKYLSGLLSLIDKNKKAVETHQNSETVNQVTLYSLLAIMVWLLSGTRLTREQKEEVLDQIQVLTQTCKEKLEEGEVK